MTKILFQGDSITDGGRYKDGDLNHSMGQSYAYIVAARLLYECPQRGLLFENRGVGSNSCGDLCGRWQENALNLAPDIISILIGTNDAGREACADSKLSYHGMVHQLRFLLEQTKAVLPKTQFVLIEPFMLDSGNFDKSLFSKRFELLQDYQHVIKELSKEYDCIFVPLQQRFNDAMKLKESTYWIWDSIHPTYAGHGLIAQAWIDDTKPIF